MAYSLFPEGTIWRSRVDGSEKQQLTTPGELARFPQWAPDGRRIACIAARAGQPWTIQIIAKDGGERTIVPGNGRSQGMATFSPDGQRIAFGDVPVYGVHVGQPSGITLVDLKTGKRTTIPGSAQFWAARWSPDGKLLAATTLDRKKLMLYNFEARQWSALASLTVNDLVWSKGGDALYFDSTNGHEAMIYKVSTRTRRVEAIASLPNVQRTGFTGWRMSLSPSDEVLILRQKGFVELYRLDVNLP